MKDLEVSPLQRTLETYRTIFLRQAIEALNIEDQEYKKFQQLSFMFKAR